MSIYTLFTIPTQDRNIILVLIFNIPPQSWSWIDLTFQIKHNSQIQIILITIKKSLIVNSTQEKNKQTKK